MVSLVCCVVLQGGTCFILCSFLILCDMAIVSFLRKAWVLYIVRNVVSLLSCVLLHCGRFISCGMLIQCDRAIVSLLRKAWVL